MAKKKGSVSATTEAIPVLDQVIDQNKILVYQVNRPVTDRAFEMIEKRLRDQEEKSGVKIVLVPYSVNLKED